MSRTESDNEELVRRFLDALNEQEWEVYADCLAEDVVRQVGGEETRGIEAVTDRHKALVGAFPDLTDTVEETLVEGDRVAARITTTGTHEGEFQGIEPTGENIEISTIAIFGIEDGKIAEVRAVADLLGLMQQLGAVDVPDA